MSVVVTDKSRNGTFVSDTFISSAYDWTRLLFLAQINGIKIGTNQTARLLNGDQISFASDDPRPDNGGSEDHRSYFHSWILFLLQLIPSIGYIFYRTAAPLKSLRDFYRLGDQLGEGSFAKVYRAINRRMLDVVAVKQIKEPRRVQGAKNNISERLRTLTEIDVMSRLRHPNICNIVTAFTMDKMEPFSTKISLYTMNYQLIF